MNIKETLIEVLRKEYGIRNEKELDEAISRFSGVDLGMFVSNLQKMKTRSENG